MYPRTSWIVIGLIAAITAQAGTIYKWTDADGVIHFSDQPHPGATKVETSGTMSTYSGAAASGTARPPTPPPAAGQKNPDEHGYQILALSSPAKEQSFFNDDPVGASLALSPGLKDGHTVTWRLNGSPLPDQAPTATQISLTGLARGEYSVSATVNDVATGETWSTEAVTFYVKQPTALGPKSRAR